MAKDSDDFKSALEGKKIPILTLDNNWHRLFTQTDPSPEISKLEEELNELLKRQGKLNTELKDIKNLKKRLMDEIVETMNEFGDSKPNKKAEKKMEDNKRLIEDCNTKLDEHNDELMDLPKKINKLNYELMLETMEICYEQIQANNSEIEEVSKWIDEVRIELKKKVAIKQQKMARNQNFYAYMHNILGADVINIFDMKYHVEPLKAPQTKEEKTTEDTKQKK
ncbi:MAG: hypothetical protein J6S95_03645 [Lachnospiraceae bacterium]|nr:hypothetical protein [Lachnospiraceae bacterium]